MKCEPRWGDLSTRALSEVERPSPRPVTHLAMRADPPPPGEGEDQHRYPYAFTEVRSATRVIHATMSVLA